MKISVGEKELDSELKAARALIVGAALPRLLVQADGGAFGTTPLNLDALDAISRALATAIAASKLPAAKGLTPLYFAYVFAEEASDRLSALAGGADAPPVAAFSTTQYGDLAAKPADQGLKAVVDDCAGFLRFYAQHADGAKRLTRDAESLRCLRSYFHLLSRTVAKLEEEPKAAELETPRLKFAGRRVLPLAADEPSELLPVSLDDIVGNEEMVKAGLRLARDVAGFDIKRGENPKKVRNQVLFVLGSPGCGKTVTAHAIGRHFLELCSKAGLPARMRVIRRTDWASSYQNQSANKLLEIFREEVFNAPGVCGVYWPDIDTAFAARSDGDIRQEERANLGAIFGILDGTIGPKNGRWFLLCDANTLRMDEATLSRLSQQPLRALGPQSPEDFVKLLRDVKLRGKSRWLPLSAEEWLAVGKRCVEEKLSGRSVDNISGRVLTEMEDFTEPDHYFSLSFDEKKKLIDQLSKPVPASRLQELITSHVKFEKEALERSETERFVSRVNEIRFHLSTQRAALGTLPPSEPSGAGGKGGSGAS